MPSPPNKLSLRSKARHIVGEGLRGSPAPVQDLLKRGSTRVLQALGAPPDRSITPERRLVWRTPEVPLPDGLSLSEVEKTLRSWSVNSEPVGHLDGYVADSQLRFLYTWGLVRNDTGRCLELGGNPYFTTWLLDKYTELELTLANYYGERGDTRETVSWLPLGETTRVETERLSHLFNVEEDEFPFPDDSFDVVLFCEMIEHMLMDPLATLRQIHRVLKPNGVLVLTTPNVARLENVLRMLHGANIYDPYSGFGPYGRHNREYTRHELHRLLDFAGFEVETSMTADGHPSDATKWELYDAASPLIDFRSPDLGHYLYVRARATGRPRPGLPSFLYRSWPQGKIVEFE
jgi:SAM-dependent methyltransferase